MTNWHKKGQLEEQLKYLERVRLESQCPIEHDTLFGIYNSLQIEYRAMTGRFYHLPPEVRQRRLDVRDGEE